MRGFHWAAVVAWFAAVACGGGEFTSQDPDASMSGSSAGVGGAGTTDISTVATGGSTTVGSSGGAGGSNAGTTAAGGGAGRDAGSDAGGGGAGGVGGAGGGGGTPRNSGDCERPSDCGGDPCIELYPGGYRVCVAKVPEATMCSLPQGQCCKSADCGGDSRAPGKCVAGPVEPYCGGPQMLPTNVCATDACTSAADCSGANALCVPSGALGRKAARCLVGACRLDRDCTAEPGGICVPVANPCCNQVVGLYCLYQDGCRTNADCKPTDHCATDTTHAFCAPGIVTCPAAL